MSIKQPPVFDPEENDDYTSWKADVEIWQLYTNIAAEKQGPAVYLSLKGQARDAVRGLTAAEIGVAEGVKVITDKLNEVFESDVTTRSYCAFKDFVDYRRSSREKFSQFIVEFQKRYREIKKYKLELPEGVQAFFLLNAANLTPDMEKLARTTAELNYKDMKDKLMKIFGDLKGSGVDGSESAAPLVKEEALVNRACKEEVLMGFDKRYKEKRHNKGGKSEI